MPEIALVVVGVLFLGFYVAAYVAARIVFAGTPVTVRNVGDRPLEGIALLAVVEGTSDVREEWLIGVLRPGETHETERTFVSDAHLAIRFRTAEGGVVEGRTRFYLGSTRGAAIRVDIAADGGVRAQIRRDASKPVLDDIDVYPGLEPPARGATPLPTPR